MDYLPMTVALNVWIIKQITASRKEIETVMH